MDEHLDKTNWYVTTLKPDEIPAVIERLWGMVEKESKEKGERCSCGGIIDCLYPINRKPEIWQGRCFQCGKQYTVIERCNKNKEVVGV